MLQANPSKFFLVRLGISRFTYGLVAQYGSSVSLSFVELAIYERERDLARVYCQRNKEGN